MEFIKTLLELYNSQFVEVKLHMKHIASASAGASFCAFLDHTEFQVL